MANIRKLCSKPVTALHPDPLSESSAALYTELESDPPAVCIPPPAIAPHALKEANRQAQEEAEWEAIREASQADLDVSWKIAGEARSEADPEVPAPYRPPIARIPSGVAMLSTPVVYKRRKKGRSAHYSDIQSGLFIEPVAIGLRSRATPDYEVDILIAADIAGKSDEEKRALVRKLRAARKGAL